MNQLFNSHYEAYFRQQNAFQIDLAPYSAVLRRYPSLKAYLTSSLLNRADRADLEPSFVRKFIYLQKT